VDIAAQLGPHILDVALEEFIRGGVEGTSMEGIAAAANISKRTLYSRFGSKLALLVSAIEHGLALHIDPIAASVPQGSARGRIAYVARKILDMSLKPDVVGIESLMVWLAQHRPGLLEEQPAIGSKVAIELIRSILEQARERDGKCPDLTFLAFFLFDTLVTVPRHRILMRHDLRDSARVRNDYIKGTLDLIARGVPGLAEDGQNG
jgi:AcrR family transcriptional regulator